MSRRRLSPVEEELGIHERLPAAELAAVQEIGQRQRPAPKVEEKPAPKDWNLKDFATKGYWFCRACKLPTTPVGPEKLCVACGSEKTEWKDPVL